MTVRSVHTARLESGGTLASKATLGVDAYLRAVIQRGIFAFVDVFTFRRLLIVPVPRMARTDDSSVVG